jgi:hypothetical protein
VTYYPGMYCDTERNVEQRIHDMAELHRQIFDDGLALGVKIISEEAEIAFYKALAEAKTYFEGERK